MKDLQAIVQRLADGTPGTAVLATLVRVEGSSYRRPGARLLILPDGTRIGSISGGCLEEDVIARAQRVAATGVPETVVYDTTSENDLVWGVGLGCNGIVRVFLEPMPDCPEWARRLHAAVRLRRSLPLAVTYEGPADRLGTRLDAAAARSDGVYVEVIDPPIALVIFGAGDDARPLARLAKSLGWIVTVADPRPAFAKPARFPEADAVLAGPPEELVARVVPDPQTVAVVMTHHYVHDVPLLRSLLPWSIAYLGLLGPRKRAEKILADIAASGQEITPEQRTRLHAPVGLDLGADGPEQVAFAIIGEVLATLAHRDGRPLRERIHPIHETAPAVLPA